MSPAYSWAGAGLAWPCAPAAEAPLGHEAEGVGSQAGTSPCPPPQSPIGCWWAQTAPLQMLCLTPAGTFLPGIDPPPKVGQSCPNGHLETCSPAAPGDLEPDLRLQEGAVSSPHSPSDNSPGTTPSSAAPDSARMLNEWGKHRKKKQNKNTHKNAQQQQKKNTPGTRCNLEMPCYQHRVEMLADSSVMGWLLPAKGHAGEQGALLGSQTQSLGMGFSASGWGGGTLSQGLLAPAKPRQ